MSDGPTLSVGGDGARTDDGPVPTPRAPDDPDAWYAPDVVAQYEVSPGVVATIRETDTDEFDYAIREPGLGPADRAAMARIREHFTVVNRRRPLTREGTAERAAAGFEPKYRRALDRLIDASPAAWRRLTYHALCELRLLGNPTPLALDDRIEVVDVGREDDRVVVHTENYAPARTDFDADARFIDRVAGERLRQYTVDFAGFDARSLRPPLGKSARNECDIRACMGQATPHSGGYGH